MTILSGFLNSPSFPCKSTLVYPYVTAPNLRGEWPWSQSFLLSSHLEGVSPCQQALHLIQHLPWLNLILLESWNYSLYSLKTTFMLCVNVSTVLQSHQGASDHHEFRWLCRLESDHSEGLPLCPLVLHMCTSPYVENFMVFLLLASQVDHTFSHNSPLHLWFPPPK